MAAMAIAYTADAAHPTKIENIVDVGDGQSLEVFWTDCHPEYAYTLYYGLGSGDYPYSISIPPGECSWVVNGMDEGVLYYFSARGEHPNAYPPAWSGEGSGVPYVVPRAPVNVLAEVGLRQVMISWDENLEADLSHYRLYRDDGGGQVLFQDNLTETSYLDTDVAALTTYFYQVAAVDVDLNESDLSATVQAVPYTFDQGILLVDETADDSYLPPQAEQEAYFDSIMGGTPYALDIVGGTTDTLPRQTVGSYSSMLWVDDDPSNKDIRYSEATIRWYVNNPTNAMIAGWQTVTRWVDPPVETDHVLYEEFGITSYLQNSERDFRGAVGQDGWPSVTMDTDNLWEGKFPSIPALDPRSGATVIYTYDSFVDDPAFEGEPCGLIYDTPNGRRIVLAFPIYFLTASSSEALIAKAIEVLEGANDYAYGDADGSGAVDIQDLDYMIDYLYKSGPEPVNLNASDADGSCQVDIVDLEYLIDYLFKGGPDPQAGCAV